MEKLVKTKLTEPEVEQLVEGIEKKELIKWYEKWRTQPWTYAAFQSLKIFPLIAVFKLLFNWKDMKAFFSDPALFVRQEWGSVLLTAALVFLGERLYWNRKAFRYFLVSKQDPSFPRLDDDDPLAV